MNAPVAQGIEHRPPEPGAQVRFLPGAPMIIRACGSVLFLHGRKMILTGWKVVGGNLGESGGIQACLLL